MATSTYMTFLMHKKETAWEKLLDITEFPDLAVTRNCLKPPLCLTKCRPM